MHLAKTLREYIQACFTGLWIESHEHEDALAEIAQLCRDEDWRLVTWDIDAGLCVPGQAGDAEPSGSDPLAAIRAVSALATADGTAIFSISTRSRPSPKTTIGPVPRLRLVADWRLCWTCR